MCFYRDTQAALERNNLQNLIKQRKNLPAKDTKASENQIFQVPTEPYKKLHIPKILYEDLLILSNGGSCPMEEITTEEASQSDIESLDPLDIKQEAGQQFVMKEEPNVRDAIEPSQPSANVQSLQNDVLLNSLKSTVIKGNYESSADFSFFQRIISMVDNHNVLLKDYINEQEGISNKIQECKKLTKSNEYFRRKQEESPFERLEKASQNEKYNQKYKPNPSSCEMLSFFTNSGKRFPYELILKTEISAPIFRERNIKVEVSLVRTSDNSIVVNHGKMLLQMSLYTWELPPKIIVRNKAGNKVLQGDDECELKNGEAVFDKIQINEVTSKFIGGCIALVVVPKRPVNFGTSLESLHLKNTIRTEDIKPLLVSKLIVKSKRKSPRSAMMAKEDLLMRINSMESLR